MVTFVLLEQIEKIGSRLGI